MDKTHMGEMRNINDQQNFSRNAGRKGANLGNWKFTGR
jgi:hypothetical protein